MPILDFGRTTARVEQTKAINQQSLIAWENSSANRIQRSPRCIVSLHQNNRAETAQKFASTGARKALDLSERRYAAGYVGFRLKCLMLNAQSMSTDCLDYDPSGTAASVGLFKALGGGWKGPVKINHSPTNLAVN